MEGSLWIEIAILAFLLIILRLLYLVHKITTGASASALEKRTAPAKTVICIGSGGHTTEMLQLVKQLDYNKYTPRHYILADTDKTSLNQIKSIDSDRNIITIPRSRVVGQSYFTSVFTTLYSTAYSIPILLKLQPDLLLCNGPGTCIPVCVIVFLLRAAFVCDAKIVFIESFCRTRTFSLSGKILFFLADRILVQWPSLKRKWKRADYIGQLL